MVTSEEQREKRREREEEISGEGEESSSMVSVNGGAQRETGVNLLPSQTIPLGSVGMSSSSSSSSSSTGGATSSNEDPFQNIISWSTRLNSENQKLKDQLLLAQQKLAEKDSKINEQNLKLVEAQDLIAEQNKKLVEAKGLIADQKMQLESAIGKEVEAGENYAKLMNSLKCFFNEENYHLFENVRKHLMDEEGQQSISGPNAKKTLQEIIEPKNKDNFRKHSQSAQDSTPAVADQSSALVKGPAPPPSSDESNDSIEFLEECSGNSSADPLNLPNPIPPVSKSNEAKSSVMISNKLASTSEKMNESGSPLQAMSSTELFATPKSQPELKIILSRQPSKAVGQTTSKVTTRKTSEEGTSVAVNFAADISKRLKSAKAVCESPLSRRFETNNLPISISGGPRSKDIRESLSEQDDDENSFVLPLLLPQPNPFTMYVDDEDDEDSRSNLPNLRNQRPPVSMSKKGQVSTKVSRKPVCTSRNKHSMDIAKRDQGFVCLCGYVFASRTTLDAHIQFLAKRHRRIEPSSTCSPSASTFPSVGGPGSRRKHNFTSRRMAVNSSSIISTSTQPIPILIQPSAAVTSTLRNEEEQDSTVKSRGVDSGPKYDDLLQNEKAEEFTINGQKFHEFDTKKLQQGSFYCICGKKCRNKEKLQAHITYGKRDLKFPCEICGKGFPFRSTLAIHLAQSHQIEGGDDGGKEVHDTHRAKRQKNECPKCGKKFKTCGDLFRHNKLFHTLTSFGQATNIGIRTSRNSPSHHQVSSVPPPPTIRPRRGVQ